MTTGTRLKKTKSKIIPLLLSATLWYGLGAGFGWYVGSNGGFHRGVLLTSKLVEELMDARDGISIELPPKYRNI